MGSGLKAQNMTGIRAQRKGLRAHKNGIRDHKAFEPESGIIFITRFKNLLSHRISWPRCITYSYFRLAAVPVIRSPGCLTKTWYHILIFFFIVEGTVSHFSRFVTQLLNALPNARRQRKRFIHIFFCEKWGRRKRTK